MNSSSSTQSSPSFNEKSPSSLLPPLDHHTDISSGINHNNKTISAFNTNNHSQHTPSLVNHNNIPPQHLHNQLLHYQQQQRGVGSTSPDCDAGGGDISDGNSDQGSGVNSGINTGGYFGGHVNLNRLFPRNNNPEAATVLPSAASMAASLASAASSIITSTSSPSSCHQLNTTSQQLQMESQLSSHYGACNPHGIDTILNRRRTEMENNTNPSSLLQRSSSSNNASCITPPQTSLSSPTGGLPPSLSARLSSSLQANPYFNAANALSQMGSSCKLEDLQAAAAQAAAAGHQRANLYWPGIQGLISNPNLWRERLALNGKTLKTFYKILLKISCCFLLCFKFKIIFREVRSHIYNYIIFL